MTKQISLVGSRQHKVKVFKPSFSLLILVYEVKWYVVFQDTVPIWVLILYHYDDLVTT